MLFFSQVQYDWMIQEKKTIELHTSKAWLTLIFKESAASVPEPILLFRIRRFPVSWSPPSPSKSSRQILTKKCDVLTLLWHFYIVVTFFDCCDILMLLWQAFMFFKNMFFCKNKWWYWHPNYFGVNLFVRTNDILVRTWIEKHLKVTTNYNT